MPRSCTVCTHPEREAIDEALVAGIAFPALVAKHRVSKDSLSRHKANHLPAKLVMAQAAEEVAQADTTSSLRYEIYRRARSPSWRQPSQRASTARRSGR